MTYQTHAADAKGISDSDHKLARLHLPADLTGKAVLDIGCNEGFFCGVAARRGATRVVGIDQDPKALDFGRQQYSGLPIEFIYQTWATLPKGPFDWVLWTSAMHYEKDPQAVFRRIRDVLVPNGTLVLECGIAAATSREMVMHQRSDGTLWYPTERHLFENLLEDFTCRRVAIPEAPAGDAIPRTVFHCARRLPSVLLVRGSSGSGKSSTAQTLVQSATQTISLDVWIYRMRTAQFHHTALQRFVKDYDVSMGLAHLYEDIDLMGHTEEFAKLLSSGIGNTDRLVVIEGALSKRQVEAITKALDGRARVWELDHRTAEQYAETQES